MQIPIVTIAIPVYNVERYVEQSLLSALNQDFTLPVEILVVDDCGTDSSMTIVQSLIQSHPRGSCVRIVRHPQNLGLGPARNTALRETIGKYLFFLDSDDYLSPDCISLLYAKAVETDSDITVGSMERIDEHSGAIREQMVYPFPPVRCAAAPFSFYAEGKHFHWEVWNKLYKTAFLRENNIHCVHRIFEDMMFTFNAYAKASSIAFVPNVTLHYLIRQGSILNEAANSSKSEQALLVYSDYINLIKFSMLHQYKGLYGVCDYYFYLLLMTFTTIQGRKVYTPDQLQRFDSRIKGFIHAIPSTDTLHTPAYRTVYSVCRIRNGGMKQFLEAWRLRDMPPFQQLVTYPIKLFIHNLVHREIKS